jgi:crotonobetainyl-CoA:carnitine CoA-transferase CaiB-like acyl-CoA transferase
MATVLADALEDVTVIELGDSIASAYASKLLADLGADVIKVEKPLGGDFSRRLGPFPNDDPHPEKSGLFLYLNTNKRSLTLDVETESGRRLLEQVAARAGVVIASAQSGTFEYESVLADLAARREMVIATITPFGRTGRDAGHRGQAANTAALGGICGYLGATGRPLLVPPLELGEYETGVNVAIAVLVCVLTESGNRIDISEADCWATVQNGMGVIEFIFGGRVFARMGRGVKSGPYPNTILKCKDGYMRLIAMQRAEWERFLQVMGNPEWANDPRFTDRVTMNEKYSDELDAHIEEWMKEREKDDIFELCQANAVPFAPIYTIEEVMQRPEWREWFVTVDHPEVPGTLQAGFPYSMTLTPPRVRRPAPRLGEHTTEILRSVGIETDAVASLRSQLIV